MSTNLNKFHLSSEARSILYRLMMEIHYQLSKDIDEGFPCSSKSFGGLLPLIYQAFIKLWCHKISLVVKKSAYTPIGLVDFPIVFIDRSLFKSLLKDRDELYLLRGLSDSENLPFEL